jgi:hypothetical protein
VVGPYRDLIVDLEGKILDPSDRDMNGLDTSVSMLIVSFQKVSSLLLTKVLYYFRTASHSHSTSPNTTSPLSPLQFKQIRRPRHPHYIPDHTRRRFTRSIQTHRAVDVLRANQS